MNQGDEQGRMHGVWKTFIEEMDTTKYVTYHHGVVQGLLKTFCGDELVYEAFFHNGLFHGTTTQYFLGKPYDLRTYFYGVLHGPSVEYSIKVGTTTGGSYRHGKQHGPWKE